MLEPIDLDPDKLQYVTHIYCDGGVILHNPSDFGGAYAFILVSKDVEEPGIPVYWESKVIPNANGKKFTNNWAEQIAIIKALELMPEKWSGVVCSDSQVALGRMFDNWLCKNLPSSIERRMRSCLLRLGNVRGQHVAGHPTQKELEQGYKNGSPSSIWNVYCDDLCKVSMGNYLSQRNNNAHIVNTAPEERKIL